jgi:hypothetical protein
MPQPESELRAKIDAAFASLADPPGRVTQHRCEECDSLNDFLAGKRREDLSDSDALSVFAHGQLLLLAPRAVQFYFPIMAVAALRSNARSEEFLADLVYFLAEGDGEKLSEFSEAQLACLGLFLQFVAEHRRGVIDSYLHEPELTRAIERWSAAA